MSPNQTFNASSCVQYDVLGGTEINLYHYMFPILLAMATVGNLANVIIYHHPFLRDSSTVRMLLARSIFCLLFVICMIPHYLYASQEARKSAPKPVDRDDTVANFYWTSLTYVLFASNTFSTIAVWMTVAVTAEHCLLVVLPAMGKRFSSLFHANVFIAICIPWAVVLHAYYLVALATIVNPHCDFHPDWTIYYFLQKPIGDVYHQTYFWLSSSATHLLPMILLIACSIGIYRKLFVGGKFRTNKQMECVTRLAWATTICHLGFELPQVVVFAGAAIYGPSFQGWSLQEPLTAAANFLSLTNASIPFLVYLICTERFRNLAMLIFCHKTGLHRMDSERVRQLDRRRSSHYQTHSRFRFTSLNITSRSNRNKRSKRGSNSPYLSPHDQPLIKINHSENGNNVMTTVMIHEAQNSKLSTENHFL